MSPGILYIVATPIGNLEDMSFRALRVLKEVDWIAAEDTRHTRILLEHYGVSTRLTAYHEHNEREKTPWLVERLRAGQKIALVADAGTPCIADPGYRLVVAATQADIPVTPIPGPAAFVAALSAGGLPSDRFAFEGFLPSRRSERRRRLQALSTEKRTLVLYEAPHRLIETLEDLLDILGDRNAVIARELTKIHEEFLRGTLAELTRLCAERRVRGEITVLIAGAPDRIEPPRESIREEVVALLHEGRRAKEIAEIIGEKHRVSKKEVYGLVLSLKGKKV